MSVIRRHVKASKALRIRSDLFPRFYLPICARNAAPRAKATHYQALFGVIRASPERLLRSELVNPALHARTS